MAVRGSSVTTGHPTDIWRAAEDAVVAGDAAGLDGLLRDHAEMLRTGPAQSTWWGGLTPDYSKGDARSIIAREHHFLSFDDFATHNEALKDATSSTAQFEAAVNAVVKGDIPTLQKLLGRHPELIRARSVRTHHATLLHYVGANGVENFRQRTPENAVQVAEVLLNAGAAVHATADMYGVADPLGLVATSIHPVTAGVQEQLMDFLLKRGASVQTARAAGTGTVIHACLANGRLQAAQFLADKGGLLDLEAAAGLGRLDVVRKFFGLDSTLIAGATPQQVKDGFSWACEYGHSDVARFFLTQGGIEAGEKLRPHGQTG